MYNGLNPVIEREIKCDNHRRWRSTLIHAPGPCPWHATTTIVCLSGFQDRLTIVLDGSYNWLFICSLCGIFVKFFSLYSWFCWLCLLVQYARCTIYQSFLLLWSCLYGFLSIRQVVLYVLGFQLVHHIYGILRRCIYPCNCCFTSNILVHSMQMVDSSIPVSLFIYVFLLPGFQVVLLSRYCILVVPSAFVFIVSANIVMMSIFVMVSVFCSPIILVLILVKCISFQHRYVWLSIIFATSLSGFFVFFFPGSVCFCIVIRHHYDCLVRS